ncbi:DUF2339 domain-containing protein [Alteromonas halophila]|uniref:DUF2339 domain-containing protein n=1 Tax=Alteromonas halophila TaxID=516698 RepID=UPI001675DF04|nr:DUF2339 domain-containing protein [Alteromonas halophila]
MISVIFFLVLVLLIWNINLHTKVNALQRQMRLLVQRMGTKSAYRAPVSPSAEQQSSETSPESEDARDAPPGDTNLATQDALAQKTEPATTSTTSEVFLAQITHSLKQHGLLWLGGLTLALGGIFLSMYAIEAGLLPPYIRLTLGGLFGISLIVASVYVHNHAQSLNIRSPYVAAALASGGVVTCYAMSYVAQAFYGYISADVAFIMLAAISLCATLLALRLGLLLALIGLAGAYLVPALLQSDSANMLVLMLYLNLISASLVYVARKLAYPGLTTLAFVLHIVWYCVALLTVTPDNYITLLAGITGIVYLFACTPTLGWRLIHRQSEAIPLKYALKPPSRLGLILSITLLTMLTITLARSDSQHMFSTLLPCVIAGMATMRDGRWDISLLAGIVATGLCTWLLTPVAGSDVMSLASGNALFIQLTTLAWVAYGTLLALKFPGRPVIAAVPVLAVPLIYGVALGRLDDTGVAVAKGVYSVQLALYGVAAAVFALRSRHAYQAMCATLLMHACIALIAGTHLAGSVLSLVFVFQIASMMILSSRYGLRVPDWIIKTAVSLVLLRLSLAPWTEPDTQVGPLHWIYITYPLVLAALWLSHRYCRQNALSQWFVGAIMHVVALFVSTATMLTLSGTAGPDTLNYQTLTMLACTWSVLAVIYAWRVGHSRISGRLYRCYSLLLVAATLVSHIGLTLVDNPFWGSSGFIRFASVVWLALLWLIPGAMLCALTFVSSVHDRLTKPLRLIGLGMLVLFVNGTIRLLFQDTGLALTLPTSDAELYSYSAVWLVISIALLLVARQQRFPALQNTGFVLLLAVVVKVFVIDMSQLEGLLRAVSFICLGGVLVGLGWLFQRLNTASATGTSS